jgi:hypothetical protein
VANYGILIWRKGLNPVLAPEGYIYTEGNPDALDIYSFESTSASEAYIGFKNILRNKNGII